MAVSGVRSFGTACSIVFVLLLPSSVLSLSNPSVPKVTSTTSSTHSTTIHSGTWMFRDTFPIFYEYTQLQADVSSSSSTTTSDIVADAAPPLLILNGFGMGSFHQHRFMDAMQQQQQQKNNNGDGCCCVSTTIYAMDYLGQGKSWPIDCDDGNSETERGLQYSADTWIEQAIGFIEDHILRRTTTTTTTVHLAGNSLGGYLAVHIAAQRPDLIASLVLINATPIWGLNAPGWSGVLPPPPVPRTLGRALFDTMRREETMRNFLDQTYTHNDAWDDAAAANDSSSSSTSSFLGQIRAATETNGGHAAFASILWSGPASSSSSSSSSTMSFWDALASIETTTTTTTNTRTPAPIALVFGRDDPWCTPAVAQRMLRTATTTARYWEVQSVGHCPQHEAPRATAWIVTQWLSLLLSSASSSSSATTTSSSSSTPKTIQEAWGTTTVTERTADTMDIPWWKQIAAQLL